MILNPERFSLKGGLSIILPCHNEVENIGSVISEALSVLPGITDDFEVIVVDDGSTDRSIEIVEGLRREEPRIKLKRHLKNLGYGSALWSGFKMAEKRWIFFTDADRQFDISEIRKLIPHLEKSRMVIGFREERQDPFYRVVYGEIFSFFIRKIFGIKARDVNCAFKIFDREIVKDESMISPGALINAELLVIAKDKGIEPVEVPVSHFQRRAGRQSGGSIKVILRAILELMRLYFYRR